MPARKQLAPPPRRLSPAEPERRRASSSNHVLNHLRMMIEAGELRAGERLPAERELAVKLKVSRPTLPRRSALAGRDGRAGIAPRLRHLCRGHQRGPPTLDANPLRMMAVLRGFSPDEMLEARLALEMTAAGLAAERADADQLAQLAEEMTGIFASVDEPKAFLVHDVAFHRVIATRVRQPHHRRAHGHGCCCAVRNPQKNR